MLSIADNAPPQDIEPRPWALAVSLGLHSAAVVIAFAKPWLLSLLAALLALWQTGPPPRPAVTITKVFAPPAGKSGGEGQGRGGPSPVVDDSTEIVWAADYNRELLPVLLANQGLIVFVDPLDRLRPKAAFRADGSRVPPPDTLQHYVRLRLANPSWWPEIEALCITTDPERKLEVMAVFPPTFRTKLGEAVQAQMVEMKRTGRVVWLSLALDTSRPAGVAVRDIGMATSAPPKAKTAG